VSAGLSHSRPIRDEIVNHTEQRTDSFEATSTEKQMPRRTTFFVPAILTICLATVCLTVEASRAADDCITKPNAPSPQGSHWYYRVDRATHRECWYLGAEGTKVHPRVRQAVSPVQPPAPKPIAQPTAPTPAEATTAEAAPAEITAGEARAAAQDDATADLSMRWSALPKSAASLDRAPASMSNGYAAEQSTTDSQDDMPLIWPIMTPQDLAAAEQAPRFTITFVQLAAALVVVLGLAALIIGLLVRPSAARRSNRPNARDRWGPAAQRDMARSPVKSKSDPAADIEASVRQLLHELQRRRHEDARRDFHATSRQEAA
jgi:hypothetical protein